MGGSRGKVQGFWSKAKKKILAKKYHTLLKNDSWQIIRALIEREHLTIRCQMARTAHWELSFVRPTNS